MPRQTWLPQAVSGLLSATSTGISMWYVVTAGLSLEADTVTAVEDRDAAGTMSLEDTQSGISPGPATKGTVSGLIGTASDGISTLCVVTDGLSLEADTVTAGEDTDAAGPIRWEDTPPSASSDMATSGTASCLLGTASGISAWSVVTDGLSLEADTVTVVVDIGIAGLMRLEDTPAGASSDMATTGTASGLLGTASAGISVWSILTDGLSFEANTVTTVLDTDAAGPMRLGDTPAGASPDIATTGTVSGLLGKAPAGITTWCVVSCLKQILSLWLRTRAQQARSSGRILLLVPRPTWLPQTQSQGCWAQLQLESQLGAWLQLASRLKLTLSPCLRIWMQQARWARRILKVAFRLAWLQKAQSEVC